MRASKWPSKAVAVGRMEEGIAAVLIAVISRVNAKANSAVHMQGIVNNSLD